MQFQQQTILWDSVIFSVVRYIFYWAVVTEKTFISVYAKVSYLSARILNVKSAFSPVIDIFEK